MSSLEGHEDETDGETDADEDEQHEQTHVDASLDPLKSTLPPLLTVVVHRGLQSQRPTAAADRLVAGRR